MSDSFEDMLRDFMIRVEGKYGPKSKSSILKIAVTHDLYYDILKDVHKSRSRFYNLNIESIADFAVYGVKILPRHKDEF